MDKKIYEQLQETIYTETLENGLRVTLLPKNDFHKTYGLFSTNFGSIDNQFVPRGKTEMITVPDGIAHFLEHKLFEKEDGDVFNTFGRLGASANAFTSFTKTAYLFSSTNHVSESLNTLLDFVQEPYFTDATVNKEKGIIAQEIQMYEDEPDWRLYFGVLGNMYPKHPLHIDIAGTVDSIMDITPELLYENHATFYHPSNMSLFVVGKLDPEETMQLIRENQSKKEFLPVEPIERIFPEETIQDIKPYDFIQMSVNRPKSIVGVKGVTEIPSGVKALAYKTTMDLLLTLLFGPTSANYLNLYDKGIIDDSFSYEFNLDRTFHFVDIGGDTKDSVVFSDEIKKILLDAKNSSELTEENLTIVKKRMIGQELQSLNSLEYIANQFSQPSYGEATLFDVVPIIESVTLTEIKKAADEFMVEDHMTTFHILPKGENEA
ncbi:peptidase, M16 family protein [Carnobacterium sp. AT7]|uniref:EF-P 5-aminopentanol modification-associated protein YfmH n=1 Tax=Carnobacterium TaxID=2747 RepID=UPI00015F1966|nr:MULTISPECIES: pitrilysin family protein [Carnobacterium]EDP68522.1 peptidase, M16 family protein [Carnobacterium sp. AT7]